MVDALVGLGGYDLLGFMGLLSKNASVGHGVVEGVSTGAARIGALRVDGSCLGFGIGWGWFGWLVGAKQGGWRSLDSL